MPVRSSTSFDTTSPSLVLVKSLPFEQTPHDPGREACWLLDLALRLADPLAVDLLMGLRSEGEPFLEDGAEPAHATWHIRREDVEDGAVRPAFQGPGHQERRVAEITPEAVERVLAEAMAQPAPPDRRVVLALLDLRNLRARLFDPAFASASFLRVRRGRGDHDVPIAHDLGGSWIDRIPSALDRPLQLAVENSDGAIRARLVIAWSLWKDDGSPEQAAIVELARTAIRAGYQVERADGDLRPRL